MLCSFLEWIPSIGLSKPAQCSKCSTWGTTLATSDRSRQWGIFRKIKHNAQTWKDPGHWRQIANISVHAPEQGGYRRLVGRDRIQVTHCGFRCRPSGRPRRPHKELGILKMADL